MKRRLIATLLAFSMILAIIPGTAIAAGKDDVTITVVDENGKNITESGLSVKVTHVYGSAWNRTQNVTVTNSGGGVFVFDGSKYDKNNTKYYTITATLTADGRTYTATQQINKDANSVILTLEDFVQGEKWVEFNVYYIADGHFPESFYAPEDAKYFGPAGDNTPLLTINVNVTELQQRDGVLYQQNVQNAYHFIPEVQSDDYDTNLAAATAFWDQVWDCMDEESKEAFKATGLAGVYKGYCLKNQGTASRPDNHCDGVLTVEPPVYVIEMYDHQKVIFHGFTDDDETIRVKTTTMQEMLDAYNLHFNQDITWTDNGQGVWSGSYTTIENGRKYKYNLTITQINAADANDRTSAAGINYEKKTDTYYLAAFQSAPQGERELVDCIVTYTDGVKDVVFNDHVTSLNRGADMVSFTGSTDRENFIFEGWVLEGGDGTILTQQDILEKYPSVNQDMTFVAVYSVAPSKYTGTVEVILNGTYDSSTATATGQRVDITAVTNKNVSLYVTADGAEYIPLVRQSTGVYSAELLNGTYVICYFNGTDYIQSSDQHLNINNDDRTRYIFFNSVTYDLNGGIGGPSPLVQYHPSEASVNVTTAAPTRTGYIFTGWKDQDGKLYNGGDLLTATIGQAYTLTAQWVDAADIYVNVTINHDDKNGHTDPSSQRDEVSFDIVFAPDHDTPYLETGDHVELSNNNHAGFSVETTTDFTKYTAINPVAVDVVKGYLYSVVASKHNYNLTSVTTTFDASGDIHIKVVLDYAPQNRDLEFEVRVENTPENLTPKAAIVKVLAWSSESNSWNIIAQHATTDREKHPGVRVDLNGNIGTGSYPVWVNEVMADGKVSPYGYRIVVTAIIYPDGSIIEVNNDLLADLTKNNTDLYSITLNAISSQNYGGLNGAYFANDVQIGKLEAVITTQGYNVTFDANGGKVNGLDKDKLTNQYKVPGFDGYVPTRDGGYVFDGWYLDPECTIPGQAGVYLKEDVTLYAKWKEPLKIEGFITVAGTYEQTNEDGKVTIQEIHDADLVDKVVVILQKIHANGYTETVTELTVTLDYNKADYYFQGRKVGFAEYSFAGIPDNLEKYRIQVLIPNYTSTFQHESDSIHPEKKLDYPTYNLDDFVAEFGDDKVANVNVHSHFEPKEFELEYSVNAEQIGEGFRPQKAEVLVTYDASNAGVAPNKWPVISQMIFGDEMIGDFLALQNGLASGSDFVWISHPNGINNYKYGMALYHIVLADGSTVQFSEELPFYVEYQAPAYYLGHAQNQELIATLIPKTYNVNYNLNGGTLSGTYPTTHTWSFETSIAGLVPTFDGFKFDGWYLDEKFTIPAGDAIDASVAADTVLYAKWIQVMDTVDLTVTINHNQLGFEGGLASNYNKILYTQLTYVDRDAPAEGRVYMDMPNHSRNYDNTFWHNRGDDISTDVFEAPAYYTHLSSEYDYGVNVIMEGYYVSDKTIEKVKQADGSTLHVVNITLQYNPDLIDLEFYVEMEKNVPKDAYPQSAEVKVLSWAEGIDEDTIWEWDRITQHEVTTITVHIDPETGYGKGSYPVWHWYDEANSIPYYYRLEVVQLNWADGRSVTMNEVLPAVSYSGMGYNAQIKVEGGSLPEPSDVEGTTTLKGVYAKPTDDADSTDIHAQVGTLGATISYNKVVFYANNKEALDNDIFRTYYPAGSGAEGDGIYSLNADGTINSFYDIPEFEFKTHNKYVFKGWYLDKDSDDRPLNWNTVYEGYVEVYAHWIETGTVAKEEADGKKTPNTSYIGFGLIGVQIRDKDADGMEHYGNPASGLRFITVLSEELYAQINAISGKVAEYGFVVAKANTVSNNIAADGTLQYKGSNVNGVDTNSEYYYMKNMKCSGVADHYNGEGYRLYTAVITYSKATGEELERQYSEAIAARAYLRYYDANGLLRTYYNNYAGTNFYGGCSISFAAARAMMSK